MKRLPKVGDAVWVKVDGERRRRGVITSLTPRFVDHPEPWIQYRWSYNAGEYVAPLAAVRRRKLTV